MVPMRLGLAVLLAAAIVPASFAEVNDGPAQQYSDQEKATLCKDPSKFTPCKPSAVREPLAIRQGLASTDGGHDTQMLLFPARIPMWCAMTCIMDSWTGAVPTKDFTS